MSDLSDFAENLVAAYLFTADAVNRPEAWQVSLHDGDPGEDGSANELTPGTEPGDGYIRQPVTCTVEGSVASNDVEVVFEGLDATGANDITHAYLWGEVDGSWEPLGKCTLTTPKKIANAGDSASFDLGDLTFTLD